ncbi:YfhD family protein [Oceanobacillus sp. CAU 1775]
MGRDEHRKTKNSFLAQTPRQQLRDGKDIEFSKELADNEDLKAIERSKEARKRMKKK